MDHFLQGMEIVVSDNFLQNHYFRQVWKIVVVEHCSIQILQIIVVDLFVFQFFNFVTVNSFFFCKFCRRESFMKIFMLMLRWFKIKWSGRPGCHGRPGGPGGPVGHDQDSQGR